MLQIVPKAQQGRGEFNGGQIVENKPIGFPQDQASVRPYSNLFYWAHAIAREDSTIGLHPHQGFEICSFVLKGSIRHYDTKLKEWRPLQAGDVQIIRAGNGISHSEGLAEGGEIFQIWFDPNLNETLSKPASYDDYRAEQFPVAAPQEGVKLTTVAGPGSPFRMDTPGVEIVRLELEKDATYTLEARPDRVYSAYVLEGKLAVNGEAAVPSDFIIGNDLEALRLEAAEKASVFMIVSPKEPGYATYGQMRRVGASR
jgi:redox-sensitive bicupin YhaK (pirin superfamily)